MYRNLSACNFFVKIQKICKNRKSWSELFQHEKAAYRVGD